MNLTFIVDPRLGATNTFGSLECGHHAWFWLPSRRAQSSCFCFLLSLLPYVDPSQLLPLGWCPEQAVFFPHFTKQKGENQTLSPSLRTKSRLLSPRLCFQLDFPVRSSCQAPLSYHVNVLPEPQQLSGSFRNELVLCSKGGRTWNQALGKVLRQATVRAQTCGQKTHPYWSSEHLTGLQRNPLHILKCLHQLMGSRPTGFPSPTQG